MYAVIESGGKQYRVELGSEIQVDRLDAQPGDSITLERVLLVADGDDTAVGQPVVDGASVSAEVLGQDRGDKIVVFKYKPKARTRVKKGFRSQLTTLRISDIAVGGRSAAKDAEASESEQARAQERAAKDAEKAAAKKAAADKELAAKLAADAPPADAPPADAPAEGEDKPKSKSTRAKSTTKADSAAGDAEEPAADEGSSSEPTPAAGPDGDADDSKKDE